MKSSPGKASRQEDASTDIGARHVDTFQLRRYPHGPGRAARVSAAESTLIRGRHMVLDQRTS